MFKLGLLSVRRIRTGVDSTTLSFSVRLFISVPFDLFFSGNLSVVLISLFHLPPPATDLIGIQSYRGLVSVSQ